METLPNDHDAETLTNRELGKVLTRQLPSRVSPSRLLPLAALAFTTFMLAASAVQVVGSSLSNDPTRPLRQVADLISIEPATSEWLEVLAMRSDEDDPTPPPSPRPSINQSPPGPRGQTSRLKKDQPTPPPPSAKEAKPAKAPTPVVKPPGLVEAQRVLVRNRAGQPIVAKLHGQDADRAAVLLPDGQIGWPDGLVFTDRPFVPASRDEMRTNLLAEEFAGFQTIETKHYLVFYQGSKSFAQASAGLLENLYAGLLNAFNKHGIPAHEAEFPLVAVIFHTEDDLRNHKRIAPDVQAYYEILSNRFYMYETSRRDQNAPEVSALRKPQTVAHEGTHQILQNIGVQPRLADWPLWLVEGLAEYCASPKIGKNGSPNWMGLGQLNLLHIATLRDLDDPLSTQVRGTNAPTLIREPGKSTIESLVRRTDLSPTDYALSWALTYYLATKRVDDFLGFLREMSELKPLEKRTPDDHLRSFKAAFGENLNKLETTVVASLRKLKQIDALPHYAVMFEQSLPGNVVRRAAMVSQSPSLIRQWLENSTSPRGSEPRWQIVPYPTKARALLTVDQWVGGGS